MNISLPRSLKDYIKERVEEEHYDNASDLSERLFGRNESGVRRKS
jgi:Arc/MetJ-type ribon-helix-helix transcriptional regulator